MKRFIDEIVVNNQEIIAAVVNGLEDAGYEVEMYEKDKFDMNTNRHVLGEKTAMLKVFKHEFRKE